MADLSKPCRECPFRRKSAPGWLGEASGDPGLFIAAHWHGDVHLPCHMTVDWERNGAEKAESQPTCFGFAQMCRNSAKLPINPMDAAAVRALDADHEQIFSHIGQFIEHHQQDPHQ